MKHPTQSTIACAVMCGLLANLPQLSHAAEEKTAPVPVPRIVKQSDDQLVKLGQNAVFTVAAEPESLKEPLSYQWLFNCNLIPGGTNKTLTINNVTTNEVGFYSCAVHKCTEQGTAFAVTQPILLQGWSTNSPITVFSFPPPGGSGTGSSCPFPYVGYINFYVPCPPPPLQCGFTTNSDTPKTAQDITRSDTKIKFFGSRFGNNGCGTGGSVTVTPVNSSSYKFTVYFPSGPMPTNAYPLQLNGFNPP